MSDNKFNRQHNQGFGQIGNFVVVSDLKSLPTPDYLNRIFLEAETLYYFTGTVDLEGNYLVGAESTTLRGSTSEVSRIKSTGLASDKFLLETEYTTPIQYLTFQDHARGVKADGANRDVSYNFALDWVGVNFQAITTQAWLINDVGNFIYDTGAVLSSLGCTFSGDASTVAINNSLFTGTGGAGNIIALTDTFNCSRRFRAIYTSIVAFGSTVGLDIDASATVPTEGFILDTVNFSGGSTYVNGVAYTDLESRWIECKGVTNTARLGFLTMSGNATNTTISTINTPVKVAGTTTASATNQRFTHSDNRLTYAGGIDATFEAVASVSFTCPSSPNENVSLYLAKNGSVIATSKMSANTRTAGTPANATVIAEFPLTDTDYIEVFIENNSGTADLLVDTMSLKVNQL